MAKGAAKPAGHSPCFQTEMCQIGSHSPAGESKASKKSKFAEFRCVFFLHEVGCLSTNFVSSSCPQLTFSPCFSVCNMLCFYSLSAKYTKNNEVRGLKVCFHAIPCKSRESHQKARTTRIAKQNRPWNP